MENKNENNLIADLYKDNYEFWLNIAMGFVHNEMIARDMIDDTFLKIIKRKEYFLSLDTDSQMAYTVIAVKNTCKTFIAQSLRKLNHTDYFSDDNVKNIANEFSVEDKVINDIDLEILRKVMSNLSPKEKDIIEKYYFENSGDKIIAESLGMVYNNTRMCRKRLLNKMRKMHSKESKVKIHE